MKKEDESEEKKSQTDEIPDDWILDGFIGLTEEIEGLKKDGRH